MTIREKIREIREPSLQELEQGLAIDENALEESCQTHSDLFYRTAKQLAILTSRRDEAKKIKEEVEAEVDAEIRDDANNAGEKITEKEIDSEKRLNKRVKEATSNLLELNGQVGIMSALKESYLQRSYMLKSMVEMTVSGYLTTDPAQVRSRMNEVREAQRKGTHRRT